MSHARALLKERLFDQAAAVLQAILKTEPDYTPARLVLAAGQLQAGQLDAVITSMQALRDDATFADQAYTLLTRAYLAKKDGAKAEGAARAHLKANRVSPHAILLLAQVLAELGHQHLALEVLTKAQTSGLNTAEISAFRLALTERVSGVLAAEKLARSLLVLTPSPALYRALAALLIKQQRLPEAEAIFLNLSQTDPQALQTVASLQREQAHLPEAINTLELYLAAAPYSASGWLRLALMRREAPNLSGAMEAYEQLLRLEPNDAVGLNNLALLLLTTPEQHTRATRLARRAAAAMPENPAIQDTLGWVLTETGRPDVLEEARRVLEQSARELGTPESRFHYGIALARVGRKPEAAQELTAALASEEDLPWRTRAKQTLDSIR
jgi:tetratricopeptide (TPR) repeat protein